MADEPPKKRVSLPILGAPGSGSEGSSGKKTLLDQAELGDDADGSSGRGPASWVLLGAMAIFVVLVPLAMLVMGLLRRVYAASDDPPVAPLVVSSVIAIAVASFAGGWLVGRFGPRMNAALGGASGALAGLVLWALSRSLMGGVVLLVSAPLGALGAHVGRGQRRHGST